MPRRSTLRVASPLSSERGSALVVAMMTMMLLTALGIALILTTSTETMLAANYGSGQEALYAADAAMERAMLEIPGVTDFDALLSGSIKSTFIDGAAGSRDLPDGSRMDLVALTNLANCGTTGGCGPDQMNAVTADRPWGPNNPRWQLYAYGRLDNLLPSGQMNSPYYVVVWVGDDPSETDNDPTRDDGNGSAGPGRGVILLRAEAFGPRGSHRRLESAVQRPMPASPDTGYTAQRGQDEQNRRNRTDAVQTPGQTLTRMKMSLSGTMSVQ
jgi:hypothetical protein